MPSPSVRFDPARLRLERLERLQWLTEALSAAATQEEVTRIIFDRGLSLVDAKAVTVFWERRPGELELVHGLGLSEEFVSGYRRIFADEPLPTAEAYRIGEPVWLRSRAEITARFPTLVPLAEREGVHAWAALPLSYAGSKGAAGLQFQASREFDEEERAFVLAVVRQCSQAIERARLFDAHKRLAERLQQIQLTAATLAAAATPRDVAAAAFRALGAIGACAAEIHALQGAERLSLVARHGRPADNDASTIAIDAPAPAAEVVRTGRALWLEAPDEISGRYPHLEEDRARREEGAWAVVPLLASGKALGALTVAFSAPRRLEADERTFVRLVAQPCAAALERARLFEEAARSRSEAEGTAALLGAAYNAAPVGLALLDRDMRYLRVNDAFARIDGLAAEAHQGRTPVEVLPGVAGEQFASVFERVVETGTAVEHAIVGEMRSAPGATRRLVVTGFPVRLEGNLVCIGLRVLDGH